MGNKSIVSQSALDFDKELQSGDVGLNVCEPPRVESPCVDELALADCEAPLPRYNRGFGTPEVTILEAPSTSLILGNLQLCGVKEELAVCKPSLPIPQTSSKKRGRATYGKNKAASKSVAPDARKSLCSGKSIASLTFDSKNPPPPPSFFILLIG